MKLSRLPFDKVLLYFIGIVVTVLLVFTVKKEFSKPSIAFVDIGRLVDGYKFKKDLESGSDKNLYKIKYVLDSLKMVQKASGRSEELENKIAHVQDAFNQYYVQTNQEITKQIWDRLNPLMTEYGKEKNFELLIGANGAGTVLYGSKGSDITDDLLQFINQKYEKGS